MKIFKKLLVISAVLGAMGMAPVAFAQANLPDLGQSKADIAKNAFKEDAVCTKCHDESENAPVLSIYQTKHGVKGDARTPTCTSCHGQSTSHLGGDKGKGRPAPDMIYRAIELYNKRFNTHISAEDAAVIGDTEADIKAGVSAGASIIAGVSTGAHNPEQLFHAGATHVLEGSVHLPSIC